MAAIIALQEVVVVPTREAFDLVEAVFQDVVRDCREDRDGRVEFDAGRAEVALPHRPVEAEHAFVAEHARARAHDVVARLHVIVLLIALAKCHVVADDRAVEEQFRIFAGDGVEPATTLDPVITLVAEQEVLTHAAENEVGFGAAKDLGGILAENDVVLALITEQQVRTAGAGDHVVALVTAQHVSFAKGVFDDVVAFTAEHVVGLSAAIQVIIAAVTPEGIHAAVAVDSVVALGTAEHIVLAAKDSEEAADIMSVRCRSASGVVT